MKPSKGKVALFVILYAVVFAIVLLLLLYHLYPSSELGIKITTTLLVIKGLIALVVWYLVACFIVWAYDRSRKKK